MRRSNNRKIHVVHLVHKYTIGGAEAVIDYLCRFGSNNVKNTICSFTTPDADAPYGPESKCHMISFNKGPGNELKLPVNLYGFLKRSKVDIVHAQAWGTYIEGLLAAKFLYRHNCKFIFAFHGKTIFDVKFGIPWRRRFAQRLAAPFTDIILAPSNQMARDYANTIGISPQKIRVLYNGIDLSRFTKKVTCAKKKCGLNKNDFVIGFVGRLDPVKNLVGVMKVFKMLTEKVLPSERSKLRLLIVGDGEERERLEDIKREFGLSDHVILFGLSKDIPLCMSSMNVYFQPSFYEGHSNTILEAMASGLPVISTSVGGTPEIIDDGETGYLFDPYDYSGMSMKLLALYDNEALCKKIGESAIDIIKKKYSVQRMIHEYEKLYDELLK